MPIYEYKCNECEKLFEELVVSNFTGSLSCPECSSANITKLISAGNIGSSGSMEPACASTCESSSSCCSGGTCPMQ